MTVRLTCNLATPEEVKAMLWGLARVCALQIRQHRLPLLYRAGVRYEKERPGKEEWQTALETIMRGHGDCEDLVGYRVGELWVAGKVAEPYVYRTKRGGMHCQVRLNGVLEDPSLRLGMGTEGQ